MGELDSPRSRGITRARGLALKLGAMQDDPAAKVNELAPGRFTWLKYKDQINIELIQIVFIQVAYRQVAL